MELITSLTSGFLYEKPKEFVAVKGRIICLNQAN